MGEERRPRGLRAKSAFLIIHSARSYRVVGQTQRLNFQTGPPHNFFTFLLPRADNYFGSLCQADGMKTTALVIGLAVPLWAGFAGETLRLKLQQNQYDSGARKSLQSESWTSRNSK